MSTRVGGRTQAGAGDGAGRLAASGRAGASACRRASATHARASGAAMVAEVGGVLGTLTYPRLILPYLEYYGHLTVHYGGPWCSPITQWCN